jgi:hypothetical protein
VIRRLIPSVAAALVLGLGPPSHQSQASPQAISQPLVTHQCAGQSYYIDYSAGSDSQNGRSEQTAWQEAPGMVGFAGHYSHRAHDCFYFKGGVTWPNQVFPLTVPAGGDATGDTYYGPDFSWYAGSTWKRPVFDAQNEPISGPLNAFVDLSQRSYVTLDDINMTGFSWDGTPPYGSCEYVKTTGAQDLLFDHLYLHGWTHTGAATDDCFVILGDTNAPNLAGSVFENGLIDGADSTGDGDSMAGLYCFPSVLNSVIEDMPKMILACGNGTISGNLLQNCTASFTGNHANVLEVPQSDSGASSFFIIGNVIRGTSPGCESMFLGNAGESDFVWSNVIYDLGGNPPDIDSGSLSAWWRNTIVATSNEYCVIRGHPGQFDLALMFTANTCITTKGAMLDPDLAALTRTVVGNRLLTPAQARREGLYPGANVQPTRAPELSFCVVCQDQP